MAGRVVLNAVITVRHNVGNFGCVFDELHGTQPRGLTWILARLSMGHGHAAKHHRDRMAQGISSLFFQTADPQTNFVKETVFGVSDGAQILSDDHPAMKNLTAGPFARGALMPSLLARRNPRTALANGRLPVLFERGNLEATVLGNRTYEHQKAFMDLLGMAALHLVCAVYASDGTSAGGLFH